MKQTAVEWLVNEMREYDWWYLPESMKEDIIDQAKAMEKEQLIMFGAKCMVEAEKQSGLGAIKIYEIYFNKTFKSE